MILRVCGHGDHISFCFAHIQCHGSDYLIKKALKSPSSLLCCEDKRGNLFISSGMRYRVAGGCSELKLRKQQKFQKRRNDLLDFISKSNSFLS